MAKLIGTGVSQVPTNGDLGTLAFQDSDNVIVENLTVSGSSSKLVVEDNSTDAALRVTQTGSGNALVVEDSANPDSTPFVVSTNGNVGIGEVSTDSKLQVGTVQFDPSLARTTAAIIVRSDTGSTTGDGEYSGAITFGKIDSSRPFGSIAGVQIGSDIDSGGLAFFTKNGTSTNDIVSERMRIDSSGVVSVNTGYVTLNNNKVGGIQVTIADDAYAEITPPRVGAHFMVITEGGDEEYPYSSAFGFVYADFGGSAVLVQVSVGSEFETSSSGPPTGTTGNDAHATLFVGGTSGKIYLENRLGSTGSFQITFL